MDVTLFRGMCETHLKLLLELPLSWDAEVFLTIRAKYCWNWLLT